MDYALKKDQIEISNYAYECQAAFFSSNNSNKNQPRSHNEMI